MAEAMNGSITRCPWCSAELPIPGAERCLQCGAALVTAPGTDQDIKGVTSLDPEAILRARSETSRPRSGLLSFITGDTGEESEEPASPESLAPPPDDVRREMLRLEMEAERARLEAETIALKSEELTRQGIPLSALGDPEEVAGTGEGADATAEPEPAATDAPAS